METIQSASQLVLPLADRFLHLSSEEKAQGKSISKTVERFSRNKKYKFYKQIETDLIPIVYAIRQNMPDMPHRKVLERAYLMYMHTYGPPKKVRKKKKRK